jgi:hypothetical protein
MSAKLLEALRAGAPFAWACQIAGVDPDAMRAAAREDDELAEQLEAAEAEGGAKRAKAAPPVNRPSPTGKGKGKAKDEPEGLDAAAFEREAAEYGGGAYGYLAAVDARLVARGFPGMSPWWRSQVEAFYASGKRWMIVMAGRGAGKSTSLVRIAATEALFTPRTIPPGQRWIWPFISVATSDARRRIVELQAIFAALGVNLTPKYPQGHPTLELLDVREQPIAFVSIASTIAGVSGPSTIGATIDEEAKLRDKASGANPSTEILASLLQTFRARPGIRAIRCSSAWTTTGSHAQAIADGDTSQNHIARVGPGFVPVVVDGLLEVAQREEARGDVESARAIRAHASTITADSAAIPTWLANPTITAVACRDEVDAMPVESLGGLSRAAYWLRENASVPMLGVHGSAMAGRPDLEGFAERVRQLNQRITSDRDARLIQFGGLGSLDPRSPSHRSASLSTHRRRVM